MKDFWEHTSELMSAAFMLVAALAWNEAVRSLIDLLPVQSGSNIVSKFFYALVVTMVAVCVVKLMKKWH